MSIRPGLLVKSLRDRRALNGARRVADAELIERRVPSLRHAWRAEELVEPKRRRELARSLRMVVKDADARYLPNAAPINRPGVRGAADELLELADRLEALDIPISPRGVLLLEQLLGDSSSPLYDPARSDELQRSIRAAADGLELP